MSVIIFLLVLSTLVIVHEWGHFFMAKRMGVEVKRFSVGFGPKLFSRVHNGTEFMVCAIPLGGYVKMTGDDRSECTGRKEEFYSHPVWHRVLIVLMGPLVNFIFAYLCFYLIFVTGFPFLSATIGKVMNGYPAQSAGLRPGDRILAIADQPVKNWDDVQDVVRHAKPGGLDFVVERDRHLLSRIITPQPHVIKNVFGQEQSVPLVGIQPEEKIIYQRFGPAVSLGKAWQQLAKVTSMTYEAVFHVLTGSMKARNALAGPIRIFDIVKDAAAMGFAYLVYVTAIISASLAIFNLFPVPVLDGGHLMLMAIEKTRGRPLSARTEERIMRAGFTLLMGLMVFVLYNDMMAVGWIESLKHVVHKIHS